MEVWDELTLLYCMKLNLYIMFNVNNVLPTLYNDRKMKNLTSIYTSDDFRSKKNRRKKKVNFQNNVLVPNKQNVRRWRHRSGYSLTFRTAGWRDCRSSAVRQFYRGSPNHWEILIKYLLSPTIVSSRRQSFQTSDWLSKTDEQMKLIRCRWVWEQTN